MKKVIIMGPGGMGPGGPANRSAIDKLKEPPPKSIKEVPRYIKNVLKGTFSRLLYIFKLVWETRPWILFVMVFMAILNGVMPVVGAFISAKLINAIAFAITHKTGLTREIILLLIAQFSYIFINQFERTINSFVNRISGELVVNHIKIKIMNKSKEVDIASFDMPEFYEKLENANREAGNRPIMILHSTFSIISTVISMVSFIAILWVISPFAPLLVSIIAIPSAIVNFIYRKKNVLFMRFRSKERRQMSYYSDMLVNKDMAKEVRLLGLSDEFITRYDNVFQKYFKGLKKLIYSEGAWNIALSILSIAVNCSLYIYIAYRVTNDGLLGVGDYSLYTGALNAISGGISSIITTTATIYEGTLFIDNMISFMNEKKTVVPISENPPEIKRHVGHTITFDHVYFKYPGTERYVLSDVSFTLSPGETAVLVGLNGAGKTTLIKLLTRLYDPTMGKILLDGRDIREYNPEEIYKLFGIIFQDFGKYALTVNENVMFGQVDKGASEEEIVEATIHSNSKDFIENLPLKYETPLMRIFEPTGIELSIGQWQKLAIARAFYRDSDILILDEPTASLDPMAEQEIFNQFDTLRKDKTTIFVSHRLSSATTASKIMVLENGCLIEEGTHAELMKLGGKYYTLFSTQAKRYIESDMPSEKEENTVPNRPHMRRPLEQEFGDELGDPFSAK